MSNDRYSVFWTSIAKLSYVNELDFIKYKWNLKEVEKFMNTVEHQLSLLSNNVLQGRLSVKTGIYRLMVSKHTSLFNVYRKDKKQIDLLLFWNNSQNPKALKNLLSKFKTQ